MINHDGTSGKSIGIILLYTECRKKLLKNELYLEKK